jgi:hypothetical protein
MGTPDREWIEQQKSPANSPYIGRAFPASVSNGRQFRHEISKEKPQSLRNCGRNA